MQGPQPAAQLLRHARREAIFVGVVWFLALAWTVSYCFLFGYQHASDDPLVGSGFVRNRTPQDLHHFLGIPDWVAIGIIVPWLACTLITIVFCLFFMTDDDLGSSPAAEAPGDESRRGQQPGCSSTAQTEGDNGHGH